MMGLYTDLKKNDDHIKISTWFTINDRHQFCIQKLLALSIIKFFWGVFVFLIKIAFFKIAKAFICFCLKVQNNDHCASACSAVRVYGVHANHFYVPNRKNKTSKACKRIALRQKNFFYNIIIVSYLRHEERWSGDTDNKKMTNQLSKSATVKTQWVAICKVAAATVKRRCHCYHFAATGSLWRRTSLLGRRITAEE